jgi:hypothetical protein
MRPVNITELIDEFIRKSDEHDMSDTINLNVEKSPKSPTNIFYQPKPNRPYSYYAATNLNPLEEIEKQDKTTQNSPGVNKNAKAKKVDLPKETQSNRLSMSLNEISVKKQAEKKRSKSQTTLNKDKKSGEAPQLAPASNKSKLGKMFRRIFTLNHHKSSQKGSQESSPKSEPVTPHEGSKLRRFLSLRLSKRKKAKKLNENELPDIDILSSDEKEQFDKKEIADKLKKLAIECLSEAKGDLLVGADSNSSPVRMSSAYHKFVDVKHGANDTIPFIDDESEDECYGSGNLTMDSQEELCDDFVGELRGDNFDYFKFGELLNARVANLNSSASSISSQSSAASPGWGKVAIIFELIYRVIKHVGAESEHAERIKQLAAFYLNENFAKWIGNGWVSFRTGCFGENLYLFFKKLTFFRTQYQLRW